MIHATHSRRAVLALAAAWSLPLAGCGFKLRGVYESPFKTLYVSMNKNSRLANDIIRRIKAGSDIQIVDAPAKAEAILTHVSSKRKREEISLNIEGRARNYELILEDTFQITSPKGYVWMPATTFTVVRETFYNPYDYLVSQDWRQYDEMQDEVVVRLLRRMAACKAPKPE